MDADPVWMQTPPDADRRVMWPVIHAGKPPPPPPVDRRNDTRLWTHYLPATPVARGKNSNVHSLTNIRHLIDNIISNKIVDFGSASSFSQVCGSEKHGCHAGCQEVGRCRTRGECEQSVPRRWWSKWARYGGGGSRPGIETQGRRDQKSKTGVAVASTKRSYVLHFFKKSDVYQWLVKQ